MYPYTYSDEDSFNESIPNTEFNNTVYEYHASPFYSNDKKPLREKNHKGKNSVYKHIPHKEKPPQVVAKRNARERRRVQAVNSAFVRLKNAVPIQNTRGKRISKVKTLLYAMDYIRALSKIIQDCGSFSNSVGMVRYQEIQYAGYDSSEDHCMYGSDNMF